MEYSAWLSLLWAIVNKLSFLAKWLFPFIAVVASVIWISWNRTKSPYIALAGSLLMAAGTVTRAFVPLVNSINIGSLQPYGDQSALVWFLYVYGLDFGNVLFSLAVVRLIVTLKFGKAN